MNFNNLIGNVPPCPHGFVNCYLTEPDDELCIECLRLSIKELRKNLNKLLRDRKEEHDGCEKNA